MDGLREHIKSVIMVQRPSNLDYSCALALVQEEAMESNKKKDPKHYEPSFHRMAPKYPVPLPDPPKIDKALGGYKDDDCRSMNATRATSTDDKLHVLRQYRRARGLCDKCVEKWSHDHKCPPNVQLHAMQEMWELFQGDEAFKIDEPLAQDEEASVHMVLSQAAYSGVEAPRTMKLVGCIHGKDIIILVDLGSSNTFLSTAVVQELQGQSKLSQPMNVKLANGESVQCNSEIQQARWSVDGYQFYSDLKILPLQFFDMILGYDWLEKFSPIKVHWKAKWMAIPFQGETVVLQGILPVLTELLEGAVVHVCQVSPPDSILDDIDEPPSQAVIPPEVLPLLQHYADVFAPLSELPPSRACNHAIPLIPRARPVNIRPYRYALAIKMRLRN